MRLTLNVNLSALVKETKTVGSRATSNQVSESTGKYAFVDVGSISCVGSVVTAGELCLVTTFGLGLLDGHVVGNRESNLSVSLVVNAIGVTKPTRIRANWGQRSHRGSETEDCSDWELHLENED